MDEIIGIGLGAASSIGGQMYGANQAAGAQQQQVEDQKGLMELGNNLAYKNWIRTNYSAQMEQMKKAGVNPALMYGKGGAGGTLGGAPGGNASKADIPTMDLASSINNARALQSQIDVNEAQAKKLNAEADKTKGVDTDLTRTQINGNQIANDFSSMNFGTALEKSKAELNNVNANTEKQVAEGKISKIDGTTRLWNNVSEIVNTMMSTKKMDNEIKQQWEKIQQNWKDLELKNKGLDIEQQKVNIQEFNAETQRNLPSLMQATGGILQDGLKSIYSLFGIDKDDTDTTSKVKKD